MRRMHPERRPKNRGLASASELGNRFSKIAGQKELNWDNPMAQTILVVDDDPVQRRLLETAISRSGMAVVTAPGGQPALDLINGQDRLRLNWDRK